MCHRFFYALKKYAARSGDSCGTLEFFLRHARIFSAARSNFFCGTLEFFLRHVRIFSVARSNFFCGTFEFFLWHARIFSAARAKIFYGTCGRLLQNLPHEIPAFRKFIRQICVCCPVGLSFAKCVVIVYIIYVRAYIILYIAVGHFRLS